MRRRKLNPAEATRQAITYWEKQIEKLPSLNPECDYMTILILNESREIITFNMLGFEQLSWLCDLKLILRVAILTSASGILLLQNKRNGSLEPSQEDIQLANRLIPAARVIEIEMVDHVIMSKGHFYSLRQSGRVLGW